MDIKILDSFLDVLGVVILLSKFLVWNVCFFVICIQNDVQLYPNTESERPQKRFMILKKRKHVLLTITYYSYAYTM